MGTFSRPVLIVLMVAIFAMPLLAVSHCLEAISSDGGSARQLGVAVSDHDDCDAEQHGVNNATGPESQFEIQTPQSNSVVHTDVVAPLNYDSASSLGSQDNLPVAIPQPSKQSLNCTFLI